MIPSLPRAGAGDFPGAGAAETKKGIPWKTEIIEGINLVSALFGWNIPTLVNAVATKDVAKVVDISNAEYISVGMGYTVKYKLHFEFDDSRLNTEDYGIFYYRIWVGDTASTVYEDWSPRGQYKPWQGGSAPNLTHEQVEASKGDFIIDEDKSWDPSGSFWLAAKEWNCTNTETKLGIEAKVYRFSPYKIIHVSAGFDDPYPTSDTIEASWSVSDSSNQNSTVRIRSPFWIDNLDTSDGDVKDHHGGNFHHNYLAIVKYDKIAYENVGTKVFPTKATLVIDDLDPVVATLPPPGWGWKRDQPPGTANEFELSLLNAPAAVTQQFTYEGRHGDPVPHDDHISVYTNEWGLKAKGQNSIEVVIYNAGKLIETKNHRFDWKTTFTKQEPFSTDCLPDEFRVADFDSHP